MNPELYPDYLIRQALENGDAPAVTDAHGTCTYRELNSRVNRFANGLLRRGVRPGDRIMTALPKDITPIIAMLGIMKAGAVVVPVSQRYPEGRIRLIREDSGAVMMITAEDGEGTGFEGVNAGMPDSEPPRPPIDGSAPCIILFTSGSTGSPKGVVLCHRGYVDTARPVPENVLSWTGHRVTHTFLGTTPITFAFFYVEYCIALANGVHYIMSGLERSFNPLLMAEDILKYRVDTVAGTPSRILQYLEVPAYADAVRGLRFLAIGGERVPAELPETVHAIAPGCTIVNSYSMTESAGSLIAGVIDSGDKPFGTPAFGWILVVVDEKGRPVPDGESGELLLGGPNRMIGYLNMPQETAARMIRIGGVDFFRTGDLVCRRNGAYRMIERIDFMIKLRGLRMEPGEIESVIQSFQGCRIEKAVARVNTIHGTEHLCAYYTAAEPADESALREHLKHYLPDYMVPDYFRFLEKFPLNPNGKIDYKLLPPIDPGREEIVRPASDLERRLLDECRVMTGHEEFGVTTPLSFAGFTSLTYIRLASFVLDLTGYGLKLTDLMAGKETVRSIAERVSQSAGAGAGRSDRLDCYPLAPQQLQFTVPGRTSDLYRKFTFGDRWNDAERVRSAFIRVINRFPYLYTTFRRREDEWVQLPWTGPLLKEEDIPLLPGEPDEEALAEFCVPYALETADRLFDLRVYAGEKVTVLLHMQHILIDHVFMEDLISFIRAALIRPDDLPAEHADFFAYVREISGMEPETSKLPEPSDAPRPVREQRTVQSAVEHSVMLPVLTRFGLEPAEYLFGLVAQACLRVMNQPRATLFNLFGGRNEARYFRTAGFFPYLVPVPVERDDQFFRHVKQDLLEAIRSSSPCGDAGYRALAKHEYRWPVIAFSCMEYIGENGDFDLLAFGSERNPVSEAARSILPHVYFDCYILKEKMAVVNLIYDPESLPEESARAIAREIVTLSGESGRIASA